MALGFPFGFRVANAEPLDNKYGPYPDIATALASVVSGERFKGLTVNIDDDEYWWKAGTTDVDLVLKESAGSISELLAEDNDAEGNDIVDLGNLTLRTGKNIDTEVGGTMSFGANAAIMNWGNAGTVHNFFGGAINFEGTQHYIEDKLITLNKGGSAASGVGSGYEIEEDGVITGYHKTDPTRSGFLMKAPAFAFAALLSLGLLSADRTYSLPNESGTIQLSKTTLAGYGITDAWSTSSGAVLSANNTVSGAFNINFTNTEVRFGNATAVKISNRAGTFDYSIVGGGITAARTLTLPVVVGPRTILAGSGFSNGRIAYSSSGAAGEVSFDSTFNFLSSTLTTPQLLVGATGIPVTGSIAEFRSTTLGLVIPKPVLIANIATPQDGMMAYDTTTNKFNFRENGTWVNYLTTAPVITLTGDVTGSGNGSFAATISANAVDLTRLADIATLSVIGRSTAATGDPEILTAGTDGHVLRRSGTTLGFGTLAAGAFAANTIALTALANQAALTVLGNATNASAAITAIAAGTDGHVMRRSGTALAFGTLAAGAFAANTIPVTAIANIATASFLGRTTAATGAVEVLSAAQALTILGISGTNTGDQTITLTGDVTGSGTGSFATTITKNIAYAWTNTHQWGGGVAIYSAATGLGLSYDSASSYIRVGRVGIGRSSTGFGVIGENIATTTTANAYEYSFPGTATLIDFTSGNIAFKTAPAGTNGDPITFTTRLLISNTGTISTTGDFTANNISGTNTGDQTITLTGDVVGTGTGSFATSIASNAVGLTKLVDLPTLSVFGRSTAGSGDPEILSAGTDGHVLRRSGTTLGFGTLAAGAFVANTIAITALANQAALTVLGNATNASAAITAIVAGTDGHVMRRSGTALAFGTLAAGAFAANTIPVTAIANIATASFLGRTTAATGAVEVLTATKATALLNNFTTTLKGLVPLSGGGTVNFLRADGTWAAPAGLISGLTANTFPVASSATALTNSLFKFSAGYVYQLGDYHQSNYSSSLHISFNNAGAYPLTLQTSYGSVTVGNSVGIQFLSRNTSALDSVFGDVKFELTDVTALSNDVAIVFSSMRNHSSVEQMRIASTGVVTAVDFTATSDKRIKTNINREFSALEKVLNIADLVSEYDRKDNDNHEIGFIAQELYKVAPEYVTKGHGMHYWSVNYAKMVAPLYQTVKTVYDEVRDLQTRVKELEIKLNAA